MDKNPNRQCVVPENIRTPPPPPPPLTEGTFALDPPPPGISVIFQPG